MLTSAQALVLLSIAAGAQGFIFSNGFMYRAAAPTATTRSMELNMAMTKSFAATKEKYNGRADLVSMLEEEGDSNEISTADYFIEADDEMVDPPKVGQTITGTVIEMDDNGALLEIGGKMSGYLPVKEASLLGQLKMANVVEIGQDITAEVIGTLRGMPVISLRGDLLITAWDNIVKTRETDEPFEVQVLEVNRGGAVCDCHGLKAFLPGSHFMGVPDESLIGQKLMVKFLDVVEEEGKVVISQRRALADNAPALERGAVVQGTVTGLRNYGAFLELDGGSAGLLHISQISYDRIENLDALFSIGQRVKVMILDHDKSTGRVALSTKTLEPSPGDMLRDMENVFASAEETAKRYHERQESERVAREAAAKDIVAGLGSAIEGGDAASADAAAGSAGGDASSGGEGVDPLVSVAESIESILASIVSEPETPAGADA